MPPRKNNKNNNAANNFVDEQQEARMNEIDEILASIEDDQIPPQPEHHEENDNDLLIDVEQKQKETAKKENKEEEKKDEEVQLGEDEEIVDLDLKKWEKATDKQVNRQIERAENDLKLREEANSTMFMDKLNTFNSMFKTKIDANNFIGNVTEAWDLMKGEDESKQFQGKNMLHDMFRDAIKEAFEVEKESSYKEHRLPDFPEIIRSTNELMRVAMYAFTDLYTEEKNKELFDATAFGGLSSIELAKLATGMTEFEETDSVWDIDQKSDQAWEIQSAEAKALAGQWLEEEKPYEKMINEMNALSKGGKNISDNNEIYNKLAAAEWMLMQDEKMMVENPEDSYNPIPNWGNRYWKAIIQARESLNIPKHTSIRELIQNDYAAMSKAAYSTHYNERQINEQVMDADARGKFDSFEAQESEFTIRREAIKNSLENKELRPEDIDPNVSRYPYPVKEENEYEKQRNAPKENNFIDEKGPHEKMLGIDN